MSTIDKIGEIIWFASFVAPAIVLLKFKMNKSMNRWEKLVFGTTLAFVVWFVLAAISISILLRDGLGPG